MELNFTPSLLMFKIFVVVSHKPLYPEWLRELLANVRQPTTTT
jgi:hypothetical protein